MGHSQRRLALFSKFAEYPDPLIIPSQQLPHKQSFIILHGRGSNANEFGPTLLSTNIADVATLADAFPHARFVFPSASMRRAQVIKRLPISQWFDCWNLRDPEERAELQIEGLKETSEWLHVIITREIEKVGARNVVLGGLSQGCAASLIAHILWGGEQLAAVFGMCGWLPLRAVMAEAAGLKGWEEQDKREFQREIDVVMHKQKDQPKSVTEAQQGTLELHSTKGPTRDDQDPAANKKPQATLVDFDNAQASNATTPLPARRAASALREYLGLPASKVETLPFEKTPLFIGHGWLDPKVPVSLGRKAAYFFRRSGADTTYEAYERLAHWYSPDMLKDIVDFVRSKTEW